MCPAYPADPERPQPPVRLRDEHSPRRPRPVAPAMDPSVEVPKVRFEVLPVLRPRHAIDTRRGLRANRPVRRSEPVDVDMVQERREPRVLVLPRHSAHTVQITERAGSGTGSGARFAGRASLSRSASLHHLRRRALSVVRQLRRYYRIGRGRDASYPTPPAQIPACASNARGSCLGFWRQSDGWARGA